MTIILLVQNNLLKSGSHKNIKYFGYSVWGTDLKMQNQQLIFI